MEAFLSIPKFQLDPVFIINIIGSVAADNMTARRLNIACNWWQDHTTLSKICGDEISWQKVSQLLAESR